MVSPSFSKERLPRSGERPSPGRLALPLTDFQLSAAAVIVLFAVNAFLTWPLFRIEYTSEMGSIEAAFIGLSRYIIGHFPDFNWLPLWYGGIAYQDSYPPLLHMLVAAVAALRRVSPALAYHAVTATTFALAPAAFYWAARRLGASVAAAFGAGLAYSLASPSAWLVRDLRVNSFGWFGPRRLMSLVRWGEGPHLTSMLLLALAVGLIHVALEKRRPGYYSAAALALAAVALTNWIGAFALAIAVACYMLAAFPGAVSRAVRIAAMAVGAYAVAMPWLPPSTIATVRANAPLVGANPVNVPWYSAVALAAAVAAFAWLLYWLDVPPRLRFALLFLTSMAALALGSYWFHLDLLPQADRYHLEFDLAFWLAAAMAAGSIRVPHRELVMAAMLLVSAPVVLHEARIGWRMEKPIDIRTTVEYQISRWLDTHMHGQRVFAPGTIAYWMNAFGDTPLLNGGFDNGQRNRLMPHITFQLYAGDKQELAQDWLEAFGCDAVVSGGKRSREVYHPYSHPEKFQGLAELWRAGDDAIYAVPRGTTSLAHAVRAEDLPRERPAPDNTTHLKPYLRALKDAALPAAAFHWRGSSAAEISADLRPEHLLSVQVTWDRGWSARVNGESRRVWADKIGQMVVEPRCSGPCTVELRYDGGAEMGIARILSALALALGAVWVAWGTLWRKHSASIRTS